MQYYYLDTVNNFTFTQDLYFVNNEAFFLNELNDEQLQELNLKRVQIEQNPVVSENVTQKYTPAKEELLQNLDFDILSLKRINAFALESEAKLYLCLKDESFSPTLKGLALILQKEDLQSFANEILSQTQKQRALNLLSLKELNDLKTKAQSGEDLQEIYTKWQDLSLLHTQSKEVTDFLSTLNEKPFKAPDLSLLLENFKQNLKAEILDELKKLLEKYQSNTKPPADLTNGENTSENTAQDNAQDNAQEAAAALPVDFVKKIRLSLGRKNIKTYMNPVVFQGLGLVLQDGKEIFVNALDDLRYKDLNNVAISIKAPLKNHANGKNWNIENALTDRFKNDATKTTSSYFSTATTANAVYDFDFTFENAVQISGVRVNPHTHVKNRDFTPYFKISLFNDKDELLASSVNEFSTVTQAYGTRLGLDVKGGAI